MTAPIMEPRQRERRIGRFLLRIGVSSARHVGSRPVGRPSLHLERRHEIFGKFLEVFFIDTSVEPQDGSTELVSRCKHFIPAHRGQGLAVHVYESLVKTNARLSRHERSSASQTHYFMLTGLSKEEASLKSRDNLSRIRVKSVNAPATVKPIRLRVFTGVRPPMSSRRQTEMEPLRRFVSLLQSLNQLDHSNTGTAMDHLMKLLETYDHQRKAYLNWPKWEVTTLAVQPTCSSKTLSVRQRSTVVIAPSGTGPGPTSINT